MIHGLRFFALALALAGSCQASCIPGRDPDREYPLKTYAKNYEKINGYLERKVNSSDWRNNVAMAEEKLAKERTKLTILRSISFEKALERFIRLSRRVVHRNRFLCLHWLEAIEDNAELLANGSNIGYKNLTRIIEVVDNVESNFLELCPSNPLNESSVEFSFKTKSYDRIDFLLMDMEPTTKDPEVNMAKVDELLAEAGERTLLGEALQLLLSLKTVSNEGACNSDGFMVVLKNLVASRRSISNGAMGNIDDAMRRIDRLVLHFAHKYANKCSDSFPQKLKTIIKPIDTLYRQRLQASELLIGNILQVDDTPFNSKLTRPEAVGHIMSIPKKASSYYRYIVVPCQNYLQDTERFFRFFKLESIETVDQLAREQVVLSLGFPNYNLCLALIRPWMEQITRMSMD